MTCHALGEERRLEDSLEVFHEGTFPMPYKSSTYGINLNRAAVEKMTLEIRSRLETAYYCKSRQPRAQQQVSLVYTLSSYYSRLHCLGEESHRAIAAQSNVSAQLSRQALGWKLITRDHSAWMMQLRTELPLSLIHICRCRRRG